MDGYWMFFAYNNGYIPMGNDGMMKVPASTVRNLSKLNKLVNSFKAGRAGHIYMMACWTQQMSELSSFAFEEYIAKNGVKIC